MVLDKPRKNDIKKPVCSVTERMKTGGKESETGREPEERQVTTLRDVSSCKDWIYRNGKRDHLYKIYIDNVLSERWHFHSRWLRAIREPKGMQMTIG